MHRRQHPIKVWCLKPKYRLQFVMPVDERVTVGRQTTTLMTLWREGKKSDFHVGSKSNSLQFKSFK